MLVCTLASLPLVILPQPVFISSEVRLMQIIGPSGVLALPLAAGINEDGHYFRYFGPSGVRAPAVST